MTCRVEPEQLKLKMCMSFVSMASKYLQLLMEFIATSAFHSYLVLPQIYKKIEFHSLIRGFYIFPWFKTPVCALTSLLFLCWKPQASWQGNGIPKFLLIF